MQQTLFDMDQKTIEDISSPNTYKGIYSFHKYWGKKPIESIVYFIEQFTEKSDIVFDPFMGSGFICSESLKKDRRFIGTDLNPFSLEHTKFLLNLPKHNDYIKAFEAIKKNIFNKINESYTIENGNIASHFLWNNEGLVKIWLKPNKGRSRIELDPKDFDFQLINRYEKYATKYIRNPRFFTNSRINADSAMTINDLFTNRALRNIDLIIEEIIKFPEDIQRALFLTLTSSSGQMSKMVFAITNRGKTKNKVSEKIEVGSWVIGFWKPNLHFEINAWNCFESRAKKLIKVLKDEVNTKYIIHTEMESLFHNKRGCYIDNMNCLDLIKNIPSNSIKLICTDPPHSDRIPYLELSEMWNSILDKHVIFEDEIVVSNAKERGKNKKDYIRDMSLLLNELNRVLCNDGVLLLYFNARDKESWRFLNIINTSTDLEFLGMFPMEYSANSVIQDTREGSMKQDYIIIMQHKNLTLYDIFNFESIPGWKTEMPVCEMEVSYA
jgi:hypothetical protein